MVSHVYITMHWKHLSKPTIIITIYQYNPIQKSMKIVKHVNQTQCFLHLKLIHQHRFWMIIICIMHLQMWKPHAIALCYYIKQLVLQIYK